jgi:hypothetical protein
LVGVVAGCPWVGKLAAQKVAALTQASALLLLGLPLGKEIVDSGGVGGGGVVVAVAAVLGVKLGVLADVLKVGGGLGARRRLSGCGRLLVF